MWFPLLVVVVFVFHPLVVLSLLKKCVADDVLLVDDDAQQSECFTTTVLRTVIIIIAVLLVADTIMMRRSFKKNFFRFLSSFLYVLTDRLMTEKKMYFESFNNRNTTETTNPSFFLCLHEERKQKALFCLFQAKESLRDFSDNIQKRDILVVWSHNMMHHHFLHSQL